MDQLRAPRCACAACAKKPVRRRVSLSRLPIPYSQHLLIGQMRASASMTNAYTLYGQRFAKPFIDSQLKVSIIVNSTIGLCIETRIFALSRIKNR